MHVNFTKSDHKLTQVMELVKYNSTDKGASCSGNNILAYRHAAVGLVDGPGAGVDHRPTSLNKDDICI